MDKKTEITSFRTTEDNLNYLKKLGESDERSISYVINRMIEHFKGKSVKDIRKIK